MSKFYNEETVELEWGAMIASAKSYFETYNGKKHDFHQCLIIDTTKRGQMTYPIGVDSMDELTKQEDLVVADLQSYKNDTIRKIVCMWQNNCIDVPSFSITKKFCEINKENKKAEILLYAGSNAYVAKQISDIIG